MKSMLQFVAAQECLRHARVPVIISFLSVAVLFVGCGRVVERAETGGSSLSVSHESGNVFDAYLNTEYPAANGFDFPIGDVNGEGLYTDKVTGAEHKGWFIATKFGEEYSLGIHPGDDWNGAGGGNTDLGQDVFATAAGRVTNAKNFGQPWGNLVTIEHTFYANHQKRTIVSLYAHLSEIAVEVGQTVTRRERIGAIGQDPDKTFSAHLHFEFRWDRELPPTYWPSSNGKDQTWVAEHYASPSEFISRHRKLLSPRDEKRLVLVDQASYKMRIYDTAELMGEYDISLGQGKGPKLVEGDNKTPKGMYFVIAKHLGDFDGPYGNYYGGHWIKINYPNKFDADRGRGEGLITEQQATLITKSWNERKATLENTPLGGGIGFHGWANEWQNDGPRHLSWGCVVVHLRDISKVYEKISEGSMVVIF